MLAEVVMFIQLLGMATLAAILPSIVVILALILIYLHRDQIKYWLRVASRTISWVLLKAAWAIIYLIDGKEAANKRL